MLERAGIAAVGCNIHDHMITYLYVSAAPWVAKTGEDGRARFDALPAGIYAVKVWHPQLRPGQAELAQSVTLATGTESKDAAFSLNLMPDPRGVADRERARY